MTQEIPFRCALRGFFILLTACNYNEYPIKYEHKKLYTEKENFQ